MYRHVLPASISKGKLTPTIAEDVRDAGQRSFLANPKAARHAVALHNSQRPRAHFLALPQDVCRPLRSRHQRQDCHNRPSGDLAALIFSPIVKKVEQPLSDSQVRDLCSGLLKPSGSTHHSDPN